MAFTQKHLPYLRPEYQAAFVRGALEQGDSGPYLERRNAAKRGDPHARACIKRIHHQGRADIGFAPLLAAAAAPILIPVMTDLGKEALNLFFKARQGDSQAAAEYNRRLALAKRGDPEYQRGFKEAMAYSASLKGI